MNIVVDKNELLAGLHKLSAHFGMKLSAPELVASTADDEEKISIMLQASAMELLKLLSPYAMLDSDALQLDFTLKMPVNWKSGRLESLAALCKDYLLHSLFSRWLDFVNSDSAGLYRALNKETAAAILHILSLREKPLRD